MRTSTDVPEPIRELLAAISDTLDLPAPSPDPEDQAAHRILTARRIHAARLAIRRVLGGDPRGAQWEADFLRFQAREHRTGYRTPDQATEPRATTQAGRAIAGRRIGAEALLAQAAEDYAEGEAQRRAAADGLRPGDPGLIALAAESAAERLDDGPGGTAS